MVSKEDRERNRQVLLKEIETACQAEHEERLRERQKKLKCRSDLLGQMDYNERRRRENREEEARMVEKQKQAEQLLEDETKYLLAHPLHLKWNSRRTQIPDEYKISCTEPY